MGGLAQLPIANHITWLSLILSEFGLTRGFENRERGFQRTVCNIPKSMILLFIKQCQLKSKTNLSVVTLVSWHHCPQEVHNGLSCPTLQVRDPALLILRTQDSFLVHMPHSQDISHSLDILSCFDNQNRRWNTFDLVLWSATNCIQVKWPPNVCINWTVYSVGS